MSSVITSKPPLPAAHAITMGAIDDGNDLVSPSIEDRVLKTSQRETMSDGTILGLKDIFYQNEPDLTYYCSACKRFITLLFLKNHKAYHNALDILEFSQMPSSSKILLTRRNQIVKQLKEDCSRDGVSLDIKSVQLIDDAYELLKQELEDTFESCRKIEENIQFKVDSYDLSCSTDFVSAIGHCSDQNERWKSKMEDSKVYQDYFGNDSKKAFLALYDGYNGRYASAVAANELHYLLLTEIAKFDSSITCKCTFNMLEENDISQYDLIRPPSVPCGHKRRVHQESNNTIQQIVYTCEDVEKEEHHLSSHHPINSKPSEDDLGRVMSSRTQKKVKDEYCQSMKAAFRRAYKLTDRVLAYGGDEKSRVRWSGCSAVTAVLEQVEPHKSSSQTTTVRSSEKTEEDKEDDWGSKEETNQAGEDKSRTFDEPRTVGRLHLANTGNCQAVLVRDNRPYLLTKSHTYENVRERNRITSSGGTFSQSEKEMRVNGVSLTTRGLGNHGDPTLKELISCEPHCNTIPIDQYSQLLILATHGVWQVFSPQEAAELLLQILPQNRMPTPGYISPSVEILKHTEEPNEGEGGKHTPLQTVAADDEFADEVIPLPPEDPTVAERKSSLSVPPTISAYRSKDHHSPSVTFKESENPGEDVSQAEQHGVNKPEKGEHGGLPEAEEEEEDELREIRSEDSGNEADVDTDWASTVPPNDLALRSALSSRGNPHRHLSKLLSERLVQSALLAGAKDNISVIVVILPGTKLFESLC